MKAGIMRLSVPSSPIVAVDLLLLALVGTLPCVMGDSVVSPFSSCDAGSNCKATVLDTGGWVTHKSELQWRGKSHGRGSQIPNATCTHDDKGLRFADLAGIMRLHGERGVVDSVFDLIGGWHRRYVEVCSRMSRKHCLSGWLNARGWHGVALEYTESPKVRLLDRMNQVVVNHGGEGLDLLRIVADKGDYHLWRAVEHTIHPRVVVVGVMSSLPLELWMIPPAFGRSAYWKETLPGDPVDLPTLTGSSMKALHEMAGERGYSLVYSTRRALIFVRSDELRKLQWGCGIVVRYVDDLDHFWQHVNS